MKISIKQLLEELLICVNEQYPKGIKGYFYFEIKQQLKKLGEGK